MGREGTRVLLHAYFFPGNFGGTPMPVFCCLAPLFAMAAMPESPSSSLRNGAKRALSIAFI